LGTEDIGHALRILVM